MINGQINIRKKGFYCPSDTIYFNTWSKLFILSAKKHAPWAHIHVHIFDPVATDIAWCEENAITMSSEITPIEYSITQEQKLAYWVNSRFTRIPEIYNDTTCFISIDSDSIFKNDLSEKIFDQDTAVSWVTTRSKNLNVSLGSAVGFGADNARHILKKHIENLQPFRWNLDQEVFDTMILDKQITPMDLRYSDFYTNPKSYIWTGKGNRKFKDQFAKLAEEYKQ
jgi:hypothetical protein